MKSVSKFLGAAALAASVSLVPLAGAQQPAGQMDMKGMMKERGGMMSSMRMTGNPDVDFAAMMREHHQGALSMAEAELKTGKDAGMRDMAKKIIAAQKKEIAQFDSFLARNGSGQARQLEAPATQRSSASAAAPAPATFTEAEVRKVDKDAKKITLKPGEIKNLEMPGMTMVFAVKDESLLDKVKAGDKVQFKAIDDGGKLTVVEIQTAK